MKWQRLNVTEWVFGNKVRGIVRDIKARVWFQDCFINSGWVYWTVNYERNDYKAYMSAESWIDAITKAEQELGIDK